jgi:DNA-binding response OmpR family regulator
MDFQIDVQIQVGDSCYLDVFREAIVKDGLVIKLSRPQFRLLHLLAQNLGHPVASADLISYVWRDEECIDKNSLHVCIGRIRRIIEKDPRNPQYLMSLRKVGYILFFIKDPRI